MVSTNPSEKYAQVKLECTTKKIDTVDGKYPANQLRLVVYPIIYRVYPIIYRVLYIPGGERRISEPSTV